MIYKEILQSLADQACVNYKNYLQSKIESLSNSTDPLMTEKTQHYKDAAEAFEIKFSAALAKVKNGDDLHDSASEEDINSFLK
ncbi:hypothetical protein [Pedobacter sp.]|uniref:hypothetical protein n=1 Tax=Pedobacter sp. TaxID=1411316 RepID=UPI003D7F5A86